MVGGGIKGGQVIGKTDTEGGDRRRAAGHRARLHGHRLQDRWASTTPSRTTTPIGRPIRIVDKGAKPIKELLA